MTNHRPVRTPWRHDPVILARMVEVERRHLRRETNVAIAAVLHVSEPTVRRDVQRVHELWRERAGAAIEDARAEVIAELDDTARLALEAYTWDLLAERAVLFGESIEIDGKTLRVHYDAKDTAQFRGNKAAALQARRQAVMDKAKVQGLVVDKVAPTDADGKTLPLAAVRAVLGLGADPEEADADHD